MAKTREVKPLFPLFHEYNQSLKVYMQEVTMLANACRTALSMDGMVNERMAAILKERLDALDAVTYESADGR